jgi:ssRNA-specific RNase YbeY (16S rRNA maturation enzyme)
MKNSIVVSIRIDKEDKTQLEKIAKSEFRTFQEQCRMALHEWLHLDGFDKLTDYQINQNRKEN